MSINGEEVIIEPAIPEPSAETSSGENESETVEQLEDRLIAALERNEQLEARLAECERRISELEASRPVPEPGNSDTPTNPLDTSPGERQPDVPPRSSNIWFRKWGE